ncbi:MAG TPA: nucleotide exchange factor GrpE [Woeseiaceae bacterium]
MSGNADRASPEQATDESAGGQPDSAVASGATDSPEADANEQASLQDKVDEYWDKYLRAVAELDNVRKRAAKDVENARKFALERFASELLPVRDSLEMGLASADQADAEHLREGSLATLKQLAATLERFGVSEVDPQGEPFDPAVHEAMMMQPTTGVEPGTVVTVFQKGYLLNGRLLRAARVVVAAAPESSGNA